MCVHRVGILGACFRSACSCRFQLLFFLCSGLSCWGSLPPQTAIMSTANMMVPSMLSSVWLLYGLIVVVAVFLVIALFLIRKLGRRLADIESRGMNGAGEREYTPDVMAITQSNVFIEAVQRLIHIQAERFLNVPAKPDLSLLSAIEKRNRPQPEASTTLTGMEKALLFDLIENARFRVENSYDDNREDRSKAAICTLFLSDINQQYQQNYTRDHCDALARKLVLLVQGDPNPVLAAGGFMRIRFIRENVAIDFDTRVIEMLHKRFT